MKFISILYLIIMCTTSASAKFHYKIALPTLPSSLHFNNHASVDSYFILKQLHETLFFLGKDGYNSKILQK